MSKTFKCTNCGSSSWQRKSETEFICDHCETIFFDDTASQINKAIAAERKKVDGQQRVDPMANAYAHAKKTRKTILIFVITVMIIGMGFAFYITNKAMKEANEMQEKIQKDVNETIEKSKKEFQQ